jgi:hypothetical protein
VVTTYLKKNLKIKIKMEFILYEGKYEYSPYHSPPPQIVVNSSTPKMASPVHEKDAAIDPPAPVIPIRNGGPHVPTPPQGIIFCNDTSSSKYSQTLRTIQETQYS